MLKPFNQFIFEREEALSDSFRRSHMEGWVLAKLGYGTTEEMSKFDSFTRYDENSTTYMVKEPQLDSPTFFITLDKTQPQNKKWSIDVNQEVLHESDMFKNFEVEKHEIDQIYNEVYSQFISKTYSTYWNAEHAMGKMIEFFQNKIKEYVE